MSREWVSVKDFIPKGAKEYLVTLRSGHVCIGVYNEEDEKWWTRMTYGETCYSTKHEVIAWMEIPDPYEDEYAKKLKEVRKNIYK